MGNSFSKKKAAAKKDVAMAKTQERGVVRGPDAINSVASSQTDGSKASAASSNTDSVTTVEPIDRSGPPSPPRGNAWTQDAPQDTANKATNRNELMKLSALPPYGNCVTGKIDGGCSTTMLSQRTYEQLLSSGACEQLAPMTSTTSVYKFANGQTKRANCHISISADVNGKPAELTANVFDDPNTHFLLGLNFLRKHQVSIMYHPDGDRITCPSLGLYNRLLPRDTAGLDVLPFFADFPKDDHRTAKEKAMEAGIRAQRLNLPGGANLGNMVADNDKINRQRGWVC